jgi:hypothetical protein
VEEWCLNEAWKAIKKVNNTFCETVIVLLILGAYRFFEMNHTVGNAEEVIYGNDSKMLVKDCVW